jgi:hypothetical protein
LLATPFLLLGAVLLGWMAYAAVVPVFAADSRIPENDSTIRLEFFRVNDLFSDGLHKSGRYLTVSSPHGRIAYNMPGFDWAHRARTSIYLTGSNGIAVLGPDGEDIVVDVDRSKISRAFRISSGDWTYLGAFDFVQHGSHTRSLRFVSALEQEECVLDTLPLQGKPRADARKEICPTPQSKD